MTTTPDDPTSHYDNLRSAKEAVEDEWLQRDGVRAVGVGLKLVNGEPTDELAVRIYVAKKKDDVRAHEAVPPTIDGFPTDVIEFDFDTGASRAPVLSRIPTRAKGLEADGDKYDPLVGGISVGPSRDTDDSYIVGTLGIMAVDADTSKPVMLSNYHVLCGDDGNAQVGDTICQPSRVDRTLQYCSNCAELKRWFLGNVNVGGTEYGVDAAIAALTHRTANIQRIEGIKDPVTGVGAAALGMKVFKRGRTSERTDGVIDDLAFTGTEDFGPPYGRVTMRNQIRIVPNSGSFIQGGDSGSVLVDLATSRVVGLCWASGAGGVGVASPFYAVQAAMSIGV